MKTSEALISIAKIYIPGTVPYFSALKPDPWQAMHDDLEKVMLTSDFRMMEIAADRFYQRAKELIQQFQRDGQTTSSISPIDALNMTEERVRAHFSRKRKECFQCGAKEGLKIIPVPGESSDVMLVCSGCV